MKQIKKTINNNKPTDYQLRVMQIVMEVWEQQFLKYKDWTECWPAVFAEPKSSKGFVNVILTTGTNFTDIDIERFKKRCIEEFGENCNPALGKVKTRKGLIVRYLQWKEPVKDWPILSNSIEPDSWLDCVWYYEQIGKPWPSDILKFGNIFINGEEYRRIFTDATEQFCAMFDGVLKIIDGDPFVPVWWNSYDGLENMPLKVKIKKDIKGDDGIIIYKDEIVKAVQGECSCMEYDLTAADGRIIKNVNYENFEWVEHSIL